MIGASHTLLLLREQLENLGEALLDFSSMVTEGLS
ncbi:DUF4351 domain-containing protein [Nostoc sp. TCL26-01]|nr:DUF4351 domain-containing protein [Nostoc sp. TCL26-01]